jgi:hypothetical protein
MISFYLFSWLFNDAVSIETINRRMMERLMNVEQLVEWELARETQVFGENPTQCHFIRHKSHVTWPRIEPEPQQ